MSVTCAGVQPTVGFPLVYEVRGREAELHHVPGLTDGRPDGANAVLLVTMGLTSPAPFVACTET